MNLPRVTAIIPVHNRAGLLPRAVNSIVGQEYGSIEVIVVDDGSTDDTMQVMQRLARTHTNIRYLRFDESKGPGAARNWGAQSASGELLAFLDSDDEWIKDTLLPRVKALMGLVPGGVVGVVSRRVYCDENGTVKTITRLPNRLPSSLSEFLRGTDGAAWPTLLVLKTAFNVVDGFDDQLQNSEWWDLCARLSEHGGLAPFDLPVEYHYDHGEERLWSLERRVASARLLASKYENFGNIGRTYASQRLRFAAGGSLKLGNRKQAQMDLKAALGYKFSPATYLTLQLARHGTALSAAQRLRSLRSIVSRGISELNRVFKS